MLLRMPLACSALGAVDQGKVDGFPKNVRHTLTSLVNRPEPPDSKNIAEALQTLQPVCFIVRLISLQTAQP